MRNIYFRIIIIALTYFTAHGISFFFPDSGSTIMLFWPAGGIGLAAFLLNKRRYWPLLTLAFYCSGIAADVLLTNRTFITSFGYMTGNMAESLGSAWLILRVSGEFHKFTKLKEVVALIASAILINGLSSCIGAGTAVLTRGVPFTRSWMSWFISDGLGILLVGPFIVSWVGRYNDLLKNISSKKIIESLAFLIVWSLVSYFIFHKGDSSNSILVHPYFLVALMAWPAIRSNLRGITLTLLILLGITMFNPAIVYGPTPWSGTNIDFTLRLLELQLFFAFLAITAYLMNAGFNSIKSSEKELNISEGRLRLAATSGNIGIWDWDIVTDELIWDKSMYALYGIRKEDFNGAYEAWLNTLHPEDKHFVEKEIQAAFRGEKEYAPEFRIVRPDGKVRIIKASSQTLRDKNNKPLRMIGTNIDITGNKQIEEALLDSKLRLELALHSAQIGIHEWDVINNKFIWDERVYEYWGLPFGTVITYDLFLQGVHPGDREKVQSAIAPLMDPAGDGKYFVQYRVKGIQTGVERWLELEGLMHFEGGSPKRFLGTAIDITERKNAEEALLQSEQKYRTIYENSPSGIFQLNQGRFLSVNPAFVKMFGYASAEEIISTITDIGRQVYAHPEESVKIIEALNKEGFIENNELECLRKDGQPLWLLLSMQSVRDNEGVLHHYEGVTLDITARKQAELALYEINLRFQAIIEQSNEGIAIADLKGKYLMVNSAFCKMTGYTQEEFLKMRVIDLMPKTVPLKLFTQVAEENKSGIIEVELLRKDGTTFFTSISETHLIIGNNHYVQGMIRDITERKHAESALSESYALTNAIVDSTVDMIWAVDPDKFGFLIYNHGLYEYFFNLRGIKIQPGMIPEDLFPSDDFINEWKGFYKRALKEGSYTAEYNVYAGTIILQLTFNLLKAEGKVFGISVFGKNITEKVEKEKELNKYREHLEDLVEEKTEQLTRQNVFFRTLIDTIPNPIFVKDTNLRYTEINKAFEEYTGMMRSSILGKTVFDIAPIEVANLSNQSDERVINNYDTVIYETVAKTKKDGYISLMVYKSSFGLPGKKPEGITAMLIDITNQKEMEKVTLDALKKEKELNEMKTNFISIASHEFRTPLTTILSSSDLLERYHKKWDETKLMGHYNKIKLSVQNMIEILDDVLTLSRSDRGKTDFNPSALNLKEFSAEIIEQVKLQALKSHNIIFEYKLSYEDISADPKLLSHILSNLMTNAIKFSPDGGDITLLVEDDSEFIIFTIKDNGIGIPKEDINNIFEPFYRAQNTAGIKGTGLGLSIVKTYVVLHNGELSLESEPGKGTKFFVKIKKENKNS